MESSGLVCIADVGALLRAGWRDREQEHTYSVVSQAGGVLFITTQAGAEFIMAKRAIAASAALARVLEHYNNEPPSSRHRLQGSGV